MEINEVKVGDMVTYKNKQGKQVKGKVIHRHDGKDASHLTGHVNIQKIGGVPSFPVTVHVSDIKPHITEETDMQNENVYTMIDSIQTGDTERAETLFREIMNTKIADVLASNKEEVAKSMFNTNECADCESEEVDEALQGNQHKIDANKNGKVDAHDFKLLRKKKGVKEEVQIDEEYSLTKVKTTRHRGEDDMGNRVGVKINHHDIHKDGKKVGEINHEDHDYAGHSYGGHLHGKEFPAGWSGDSAHDFLHKTLKSKWAAKLHKEEVETDDVITEVGDTKLINKDKKDAYVASLGKKTLRQQIPPANQKRHLQSWRTGSTTDSNLSVGRKALQAKEEVEQANEYKLWRPEEQRSDKGNAFTKKGIEKGKTTPTAKQKEHGAKAVARYKINRGLSKDAKLEAYESKPGIVQSTWKSKVTGKVKPKKEHSPEDCPGCGAPTNNAEGGMCANCRA